MYELHHAAVLPLADSWSGSPTFGPELIDSFAFCTHG